MLINTYLFPKAFKGISIDSFQRNLMWLNSTIVDSDANLEQFLYSDVLLNKRLAGRKTISKVLFGDQGLPDKDFQVRVIPMLFQRIRMSKTHFSSTKEMDRYFNGKFNGLWGSRFDSRSIDRYTSQKEYLDFKEHALKTGMTPAILNQYCGSILGNIAITPDALRQILSMGNGPLLLQVFDRLYELNKYGGIWKKGDFSILDLNARTNLNASDESDTTKQNEHLARHRYFKIPNVGSQYCWFHVKTGGHRYHFYPDAGNHKIYVVYVGPHLPT